MWPRTAILLLAASLAGGCTRHATVSAADLTDTSAFARIVTPPEAVVQLDALVSPAPGTAPAPPIAVKPKPADEAQAADVPVYTLPDAIELALRNNPRLRVAAEAVERAHGNSEVAFAPFMPDLGLYSRVGFATATLSPGAPGPVGAILPSGDGSHQYSQAELDLQWTVWDFGRRSGHYSQALSRERIAALQLERARQTVAFDVAAAYFGLLQSQAAREIQEQAIRRTRVALDDARSRRSAGVAEKDDVLRAELLVAEARDAAVVAGQAEYDAVARLNYALGRNPGLPLRVAAKETLPTFGLTLDDCLRTAAVRRDEVAIARESIKDARAGLSAAEGDFLPYVYVRVGVGHVDGEGVLTGFHEGAAVHVDQQLFTGGRRTGHRDEAQADVRSAAATADAVLDTLALEVHVAYRAVTATADRIRLSETAVTQAAEYLRLIRVRYKNGNAAPIDIVDAETAATRADLRYQSAVYDHLASLARLDYAMGTPQGSLVGELVRDDPARECARKDPPGRRAP
jgi:outer membrane protein TolC